MEEGTAAQAQPSMNKLLRNTWVEINLDQLARNVEALRRHVGPGVQLAPVIKADAYGHGAVTIAQELSRMGVAYLAVAVLSEALELRAHGISAPILVMGYTETPLLGLAVQEKITLTIFDYEQAEVLSREAQKQRTTANVHIKVDTGFHRLGKEPTPEYAEEIVRMSTLPALRLKGIFSHLRLADQASDEQQIARFTSLLDALHERGVHFDNYHLADSIAAVKYRLGQTNMVRPGAILYGYVPRYQVGQIDVRPVMTFKTRVTRVQKLARGEGVGYDDEFRARENTVIATLAAGYADGYPRHLSRKGEVLIRRQRAKVIGIVCMDQMMVDVSHIEGVHPGDEAVLFGPEEGCPSVEELAGQANTNKNDIISGIARRVPRVYLKGGSVVRIVDYLSFR